MSDELLVRVERANGWASVVLNRPHRKNAMTGPMMDQLADAVDMVSADTSIAAIVLRGEGGSFSSGVDLTELQAVPQHPWVPHFHNSLRRAHIALFNCACPIVVALEGYGINGSTALALSADLLIAGETSFLQIGEINQGARIPMNAAWMRIKSNEHTLSRMALVGDRVPGPELLRLGVAHEVVPDTEVRTRAEALALRFAGFPDLSARNIKSDINAQRNIDPETWFTTVGSPALLSADQVRS
jgi:2-(1,2-epoxy-1,2-dihydrophenyl)acetyl-CoA isomerase